MREAMWHWVISCETASTLTRNDGRRVWRNVCTKFQFGGILNGTFLVVDFVVRELCQARMLMGVRHDDTHLRNLGNAVCSLLSMIYAGLPSFSSDVTEPDKWRAVLLDNLRFGNCPMLSGRFVILHS